MIKRIEISGINGVQSLKVDFAAGGFVWLYGDPASGKTTLFSALQIVQRIARGTVTVQQIFGSLPYVASFPGQSRIVIDFANRTEDFRYEVVVSKAVPFGTLSIAHEALHWVHELDWTRQRQLFVREANGVSVMGLDGVPFQYPIDPHAFALATTLDPGFGLLTSARALLGGILLVKPEVNLMRDDVVVPGWMEGAFPDLASQLAQAFQRMPAIYSHIEFFCQKMIRGFQGIVIRDVSSYGRYLYVQKGGREFSLSMLSESEKRLLSLAFVYALGMLPVESVCVWDDFLLGIPESLAEQCVGLISQAYAGGQFVALTSRRNVRGPSVLLQ